MLTLKELEKILPKVKQIVSQSVKEVLQSLVDDDVVDYDKIGSGNFFWALPSTAMVKRENALAKALKKVEMVEAELAKDTERYNELLSDRRRCSGREQKLIELSKIDSKDSFLDGQCSSFSSRGPETVQKLGMLLKYCFILFTNEQTTPSNRALKERPGGRRMFFVCKAFSRTK